MTVSVREVKSRRDQKTFIYLPEKIHSGHKNWVPPIYMDERKYFNPRKNKAFLYCDTLLLLAFREGKAVGRIMGIINERYNVYRQEKTVRFGYLEAYKDEEVVRSLLERIEEWGRERGMTKIVGPYGFTDQDPEGFLIEGFENRATIATYCNFAWMPDMVESLGYGKEIDYFVYQMKIPEETPEFYRKISARALRKGEFTVLEFKKKKELRPWIKPILRLMNETYAAGDIYGFTPLDEKEMEDLAKRYMPVIDPRFIKGVAAAGEIVSFVVALPDMTQGIQKARGRLFPIGFLKIMRAARKSKQLDLLLGAVKENYRGRGLDAVMGARMFRTAFLAGMEVMDSHHEMETNVQVRAEMLKMGGRLYKRFRIFNKKL